MIWEPENIESYLRSLRCYQRELLATGDLVHFDHLLEAHRIDFKPSAEDTYSDSEIPLKEFLSHLNRSDRLSRVSAVRLQTDNLSTEALQLHREVVVGAQGGA